MILFIAAIVLFLDQTSKFFISKKLAVGQSFPLIKGIFYFSLVHNRGAAFGILKNQVPFFILCAVVAVVMIYFAFKDNLAKKSVVYQLALSLILAGGIGNLIDRILFGFVIDFLDFRIWPVFNVADSAITLGAILLGWSILRPERKK